LADVICEIMPSIEMVRMTNSGTEATMSAIRLARGYTGRDKIVKFEGCYHGHSDSLLVKAGSGMLTLGEPTSKGVPADFAKHTITLPYNDIEAVKACFAKFGGEIAGVIVEPVAGNMNLVKPIAGFLETIREMCDEYKSVFIIDEVMTGFRVALGGAQSVYNVKPDLTTLGKIIGAGLPVGAFGGKREIMECIAPLGGVYQAGHCQVIRLRCVQVLKCSNICAKKISILICLQSWRNYSGFKQVAQEEGIALKTEQIGGMFGLYFTDQTEITSFDDILKCDVNAFKQFFHGMLDRGIHFAPSAFEAGFISSAHSDEDIAYTIAAAKAVFAEMKQA